MVSSWSIHSFMVEAFRHTIVVAAGIDIGLRETCPGRLASPGC